MTDNLPESYVRVLDNGYVGLLGVHGGDRGPVSPPSAARTSFKKSSSEYSDAANDNLTHYLMRNDELACFRHNVMTFEIRLPLMCARQIFKYVVGSNFTEDQLGWNENSKRYITDENEFYTPKAEEWRKAPENKKQGSDGFLDPQIGASITYDFIDWSNKGEQLYQKYLEAGAAPEQIRVFNAANAMYVTAQWTTSLNALLHFLDERLDPHAQWEIRQYAIEVEGFFKQAFPVVHAAWVKYRNDKIDLKEKAAAYDIILEANENLIQANKDLLETVKILKNADSKSWISRLFGGK